MAAALRVRGYSELMKALQLAVDDEKKFVRDELRNVGDIVRRDATLRFAGTDTRSAAGYRTRVRQRGVAVEQSIRKTTGKHPEFGALQMRRALVPAVITSGPDVNRGMERALDKVSARFNRG